MKQVSGWLVVVIIGLLAAAALAADPTRVLDAGKLPQDARLGKPKDLNGYFPMTPPSSKQAWDARRRELREQVLVATGLWPMPEKTPPNPVIHGKIDRDGYTIEKVFFASYPGHYVSGNLYRPKGKSGKLAGVLCPHGHWRYGRFTDELTGRGKQGEQYIAQQIREGAEKTREGARYPLQARCAQLARMGCVVFHYDMVGYADSQAITHRTGFTDAQAELRLQSFMGLQTYNSIRALDFLASLPDVDPQRIGVTGASGGGTQTFILCAIDDRPTAAFPAVMVSTAMQGGCVCENCSYLRQDTGNVELAGLFAPKPLGMSGANDWTIAIETKGLPELKALYKLYNAEDRVMAQCFPQFGHNYNQLSREVMYTWFNKHLQLELPERVAEQPFIPVPPEQLSVYDSEHPRPKDTADAAELRKTMAQLSDKQIAACWPRDGSSLNKFRGVIGTALRVMIHDRYPSSVDIEEKLVGSTTLDGVVLQRLSLGRKGKQEEVPAIVLNPDKATRKVIVWIHPEGKASLIKNGAFVPAVRKLLDGKTTIIAPDVFMTGEFKSAPRPPVDAKYAGFTFGYNRPLLAERLHDVLTVLAYAWQQSGGRSVDLVGVERAGPWVVLARALCGDAVRRTVADLNGFRWDEVTGTADEMMLPGALKYGGMPALAALCSPGEIYLYNCPDMGTLTNDITLAAYQAADATDRLHRMRGKSTLDEMLEPLIR
jgi:dienelactone hydrolase